MANQLNSSSDFALMLAKSRVEAKKTQKYMAEALGKSIGTIQHWEAGIGAPNVIDLIEWFHVLNIQPMQYVLEFLYPEVYKDITADNSTDEIRDALITYLQNVATDSEIRKLSYCIFGNTGSSWQAQLDMITAHNHSTMKTRVNTAWSIYNCYKLEQARGELVGTEHVMPNEDNLYNAIINGQDSAFHKREGYSNNKKTHQNRKKNHTI